MLTNSLVHIFSVPNFRIETQKTQEISGSLAQFIITAANYAENDKFRLNDEAHILEHKIYKH